MTRVLGIALLLWVLASAGSACGPGDSTSSAPASPAAATDGKNVIKLKVTTQGQVFANDVPVGVAQLAERLARLQEKGGEVWYYRENPAAEPHPIANQVFGLVIQHELPVSFSTRPDFSDYVDEDGTAHPR